MWRIILTDGWVHDHRLYVAAKPDAVAAVLRNLERYLRLLNVSKGHKSVEAMYLKQEINGVVVIDQSGFGNFEEDFKIYTYADDSARILYLFALAKADSKNADMEYCKALVYYIKTKNTN